MLYTHRFPLLVQYIYCLLCSVQVEHREELNLTLLIFWCLRFSSPVALANQAATKESET